MRESDTGAGICARTVLDPGDLSFCSEREFTAITPCFPLSSRIPSLLDNLIGTYTSPWLWARACCHPFALAKLIPTYSDSSASSLFYLLLRDLQLVLLSLSTLSCLLPSPPRLPSGALPSRRALSVPNPAAIPAGFVERFVKRRAPTQLVISRPRAHSEV